MKSIAHGPGHELVDHLAAVAQAAPAAVDTASAPWCHLAGLWHDLGKFHPGFQSYVRQDDEAHIEHDRSAARGEMSTRGLYVFEHECELGNAHAHALFDRLSVARSGDPSAPARDFGAYSVGFDGRSLAIGERIEAAPGVALTRRC